MLTIDYLKHHPQHAATIARWIYDEWCSREGMTFEDVLQRTLGCANDDRIPLTLVAIDGDACVGTVSLFVTDLGARPDLTPWLAALYVAPERRNQGVGSALIEALLDIARRLGVTRLYLHTETAAPFYARRGWQFLLHATNDRDEPTEVFVKEL